MENGDECKYRYRQAQRRWLWHYLVSHGSPAEGGVVRRRRIAGGVIGACSPERQHIRVGGRSGGAWQRDKKAAGVFAVFILAEGAARIASNRAERLRNSGQDNRLQVVIID